MPEKIVRKPLIAAIMSFMLPGYGQLYNSKLNKGIMLFMLFALCSIPLLAFAALYVPSSMMIMVVVLGLVVTLSLWLYGIKDAYQCAKHNPLIERKAWQVSSFYIVSLIAAMLIILPSITHYIRQHYVASFHIPSNSMLPTIMAGDFLFVDKRYNCPICKQNIQRGDISVFVHPNNRTRYYIKRIIALPNDKVKIVGQQVFVNNQALSATVKKKMHDSFIEEKITGTIYQTRWQAFDEDIMTELVVPQGRVFVLGDNRSISEDSRDFGTVPLNDIVGKARQVWFSWGEEGVRWQRLGQVLR